MTEPRLGTDSPGMAELRDIARRHYETGEFAGSRLKMGETALQALRANCAPPPEPAHSWEPRPLGDIAGIPIDIEPSMEPASWRLVDGITGVTLREGRVEPDTTEAVAK